MPPRNMKAIAQMIGTLAKALRQADFTPPLFFLVPNTAAGGKRAQPALINRITPPAWPLVHPLS